MERAHVSKMLELERGLRSPWKVLVLPNAKKAFLALEISVETDSFAKRLLCHFTPRQLAECFVVMVLFHSVNWMGSGSF